MTSDPANQQSDGRSKPQAPARSPWLLRVPQWLLWVIIILPFALNASGSKHDPGEVVVLPVSTIIACYFGAPVSLVLAILSFRQSSNARRVGLVIIILVGGMGTWGFLSELFRTLR
ncbi:MAG: hypothetical protein ABSH22_18870 [Tepidisphaeraceae bacterium]|jgi:hypothetical protein